MKITSALGEGYYIRGQKKKLLDSEIILIEFKHPNWGYYFPHTIFTRSKLPVSRKWTDWKCVLHNSSVQNNLRHSAQTNDESNFLTTKEFLTLYPDLAGLFITPNDL